MSELKLVLASILELKTELNGKIDAMKSELSNEIQQISVKFNARMDVHESRLQSIEKAN